MAISQSTQAVLDRQGSLSSAQSYEVALDKFERTGVKGQWIDNVGGLRTIGDDFLPTVDVDRETPQYLPNSNVLKESFGGSASNPDLLADTVNPFPEQTTSPTVGGGTTSGMTTTQFAQAFQAAEGRAPTNDELLTFTQQRAEGVSPDAIVSAVKAKTFADNIPTQEPPGTTVPSTGFDDASTTDLSDTVPGLGGDGTRGVSDSSVGSSESEAERALAIIENRKKLFEDTKTDLQKQDDSLLTQELDQIAGLEGKAAFKTGLEQEKFDPLEKQLDELAIEMASLRGDKQRLLAEQQGKPITMASIIGSQAQIRAVLDASIFSTAAMIDALNGNMIRAEKAIDRAVDAKYAPAEEKLAITQAQRAAIAPTLTKEETIQKDALDELDRIKAQELADKKAEDKSILSAVNSAIGAGVTDRATLDYIGAATSEAEAQRRLAESLPDVNVSSLQNNYPDAGIELTDTFAEANAKLANSPKRQKELRVSGGGTTESDAVSLYSGIMQQAIGAGATTSDEVLAGVQAVADSTGVNLSVKQLNAIRARAGELLLVAEATPTVAPTVTPTVPEAPAKSFQEQGLGTLGLGDESFLKALEETTDKISIPKGAGKLVDSIGKFLFGN